jgi:hypothetical protein
VRSLDVGARAFLAVVFVVALFGKASGRESYSAFVRSLRQMAVVPTGALRPAASAIVATEGLIVILLLTPARWSAIAGFTLAGGLLMAFTVAIVLSLSRGRREPCRCFGPSDAPLGRRHIVRNLALTAVAVLGLSASLSSGALHVATASLAVFTGLVAGVLITALDDIVALFRSPT